MGAPAASDFVLETHPLAYLGQDDLLAILGYLATHPTEILKLPQARELIAAQRLNAFGSGGGKVRAIRGEAAEVIPGTTTYNIEQARSLVALGRPDVLLRPVLSLDKIANNLPGITVLSVGPRTECEILALLAYGFRHENIKALDLFSYSPWVDVGDMCRMPYPGNAFDLIVLGWVMAYSTNPAQAAREVVRVGRPGAVVAIGVDYDPAAWDEIRQGLSAALSPTIFRNSSELLDLFRGDVGHVFFRHDAEAMAPGAKGNTLVVFDLRK
jgi:SAM-dependent methyltransferase